jgi:uncharacterized protein (DUF1330 family)
MQQVDDVDRYGNDYLPGLRRFLAKYGAEVLVALDADPGEDEPPNSNVVIRFGDTAAAWAFLKAPDYQPVKNIRFSVTSQGQMVVAPEFKPAL